MRGRVLIVEDDPDVLGLYRLLLARREMEVWNAVRTGEEAVDLYRAKADPPDVVLLDHRLPGCTGLEAANRILDLHPAALFVLVTADESAISIARAMGIKWVHRKPVGNAKLVQSLMQALDEAESKAEGEAAEERTGVADEEGPGNE